MSTATITRKQENEQQKKEASDFILKVFASQERPTVWTILKHVSSSGMSRDLKCVTYYDGRLIDITWYVDKVSGVATLKERNGQRVLRVNGAGMDMGFHVVYSLSYALYPQSGGRGYDLHHEGL
jgi:hypothetical protein